MNANSAEEKAQYLKEVEAQMKLLGKDGFSTRPEEVEEVVEIVKLDKRTIFPQLS